MNTKLIAFLIVALILFAGAFVWIKQQKELPLPGNPGQTVNTKKELPKNPGQTVNTTVAPPEKVFEIVIRDRKIVSGSGDLKVNKGDNVTVKITINEEDGLILRGYNKSIALQKDKQGVLSFVASIAGKFSFELGESNIVIGSLEVVAK